MSGVKGMHKYHSQYIFAAKLNKAVRAGRFAELIKTKTLEQIAALESPPISRERVRQILASFGISSSRMKGSSKTICKICGKLNRSYSTNIHKSCMSEYTRQERQEQAVLHNVKCTYCNNLIVNRNHETRTGLNKHALIYTHFFCNNSCQGKWMAIINGNGKFSLKVPCLNCHDLFKFVQNTEGFKVFCSISCNSSYRLGKYASETRHSISEHRKKIEYTYLVQKVKSLKEDNNKFGLKPYGVKQLQKYANRLLNWSN
ncbi:hypothetical protein HYS94_02000 [Candidatus Daviesbacteria bacterium]|nr:hypothetical protein [Candidatus Daviesbacteria bacterium]